MENYTETLRNEKKGEFEVMVLPRGAIGMNEGLQKR